MMNKKGQSNIVIIILVLIIIAFIIIGASIIYNQNVKVTKIEDTLNKNEIEYQILKGIILDYYNLPDINLRNKYMNTKKPCKEGTRAFSKDGLIEYDIQCSSNETHVKLPIIYYEHNTEFYIYQDKTLIPVIVNALKDETKEGNNE